MSASSSTSRILYAGEAVAIVLNGLQRKYRKLYVMELLIY